MPDKSDDKSPKKEIALEARATQGQRLFSPSAGRNREVVRDELVRRIPPSGIVVEIGAGTGEHAMAFAEALPGTTWRPGDPDTDSRASIAAWTAHTGLANVGIPHTIDVSTDDWTLPDTGAIEASSLAGLVSLNMIHIAPFEAAQGLFAGAGRYLVPGGVMFLYGPFARDGVIAPSNADFDASLKSRDPRWGVRDLERDLIPLANKAGLKLETVVEMPANNCSVIFSRTA